MGTTHRKALPIEPHRWLTLAAVLIVGLALGDASFASSVSLSSGVDVDEHAKQCDCGPKCRQASCCGPRKTKVRPSTSSPSAEPLRANSSLCLNSAPCGDSGLPSAPSTSPLTKSATLSMIGHILPRESESLLLTSSRCILPARRASRLDEPPDETAIA